MLAVGRGNYCDACGYAVGLKSVRNCDRTQIQQCDTLRFSHSGIPSITFGLGEDGWSPVNEFIDIEKVVAATKIYALFLLDFFKVEET